MRDILPPIKWITACLTVQSYCSLCHVRVVTVVFVSLNPTVTIDMLHDIMIVEVLYTGVNANHTGITRRLALIMIKVLQRVEELEYN